MPRLEPTEHGQSLCWVVTLQPQSGEPKGCPKCYWITCGHREVLKIFKRRQPVITHCATDRINKALELWCHGLRLMQLTLHAFKHFDIIVVDAHINQLHNRIDLRRLSHHLFPQCLGQTRLTQLQQTQCTRMPRVQPRLVGATQSVQRR